MKSRRGFSWFLICVLGVSVLFITAGFVLGPEIIERQRNRIKTNTSPLISEKVREFHEGLVVADLHADSLLWNRDLLVKNLYGHVDIPRLIEGNVALQVFTVVTKTPKNLNIYKNKGEATDQVTLLAMAQGWPVRAWKSSFQRALYQSEKLRHVEARSKRKFTIIKSSQGLRNYLIRRASESNITAGILGIEGAHALEGKLDNFDKLYEAGFRIISPTHFFDNDVGGSAHGINKGGLTPFGRLLLKRMERKGVVLDLAHASPQVIDDAIAMTSRPVVVSHTGVQGVCSNPRNLTDAQIIAVAKTGGLIGIGYWKTATCGDDEKAIVRSIRYVRDLVGVDHVGLGSDFDGSVSVPFDVSGLARITNDLIRHGFSNDEIKKIMGENVIRLFLRALPPTDAT